MNVIQNQPFAVVAKIYNRGQTDASAVSIAAYLNGDLANQLARVNNLNVAQGAQVNQSLSINGLATIGPQRIMLVVDPSNSINEGGAAQEANNYANLTLDVTPPPNGYVAIGTPGSGQTVDPGTALSVTGYVRDSTNDNGISGIQLTIELRSPTAVIATNTTSSGTDGLFVGEIVVPDVQDGAYSVVVTPTAGSITPQTQSITITKTVPFLNRTVPILGLPYWLFFIILAAAAAAVIGVTLYWKIYGLGKMVECGECGAFIPEDSTSCPKCGVEFEKDMAKCSNCQAWIPIDVKQCPECGVEFATGEVEMADYQEKMRLQYDEVVQKFKEEASRQLGRALSDRDRSDPATRDSQAGRAAARRPEEGHQEAFRWRRGRRRPVGIERRHRNGRRTLSSPSLTPFPFSPFPPSAGARSVLAERFPKSQAVPGGSSIVHLRELAPWLGALVISLVFAIPGAIRAVGRA